MSDEQTIEVEGQTITVRYEVEGDTIKLEAAEVGGQVASLTSEQTGVEGDAIRLTFHPKSDASGTSVLVRAAAVGDGANEATPWVRFGPAEVEGQPSCRLCMPEVMGQSLPNAVQFRVEAERNGLLISLRATDDAPKAQGDSEASKDEVEGQIRWRDKSGPSESKVRAN